MNRQDKKNGIRLENFDVNYETGLFGMYLFMCDGVTNIINPNGTHNRFNFR